MIPTLEIAKAKMTNTSPSKNKILNFVDKLQKEDYKCLADRNWQNRTRELFKQEAESIRFIINDLIYSKVFLTDVKLNVEVKNDIAKITVNDLDGKEIWSRSQNCFDTPNQIYYMIYKDGIKKNSIPYVVAESELIK